MENKKRLIDANALLREFNPIAWESVYILADKFLGEIKCAPTIDAVEVVRCKECKKWEYDENFSGFCVEWRRRTLGDVFCSYGERKEYGKRN